MAINTNENSFSLSVPISPYRASAYTDTDFANKAKSIIDGLTRIASYIKQINAYERAQVNRADYSRMFGMDDVVGGTMDYPRQTSGTAGAQTTRPTVYSKFYLTAQRALKCFYNIDTSTLSVADGYLLDMTTQYSMSLYDAYVSTLGYNFGIEIDYDFWSYNRYSSDTLVNDTDSVFYSTYINTMSTPFTQIEHRACDFICGIFTIVARMKLWMRTVELAPVSQGGFGNTTTFEQKGMTRFTDYWAYIFQLKPAPICQIRQAITKVRCSAEYADYINFILTHENASSGVQIEIDGEIYDHDDYGRGEGICDTCDQYAEISYSSLLSDELAKRNIQKLEYGQNTTTPTEISDKTRDPTIYTNNATIEDDPLYVLGTGIVPMYDVNNQLTTTLGVGLIRKYAAKRAMVAWDYKEVSNPNAAEANGGKAVYRLSNMRSWLNSTKRGLTGWKVKTHEYDDFWQGGQEGYLSAISEILRSNIALTVVPANEQYTAADFGGTNITKKIDKLQMLEDWISIPTLRNYHPSAREWSGVKPGYDTEVPWEKLTHLQTNSKQPLNYSESNPANGAGGFGQAYYKNGSTNVYYARIGVNPNFKGDTTDYTADRLYLYTRTVALNTANTHDSTIANSVALAAIYAPVNGSSTINRSCIAPTSYYPTHYCMTLVGFHADKLDGVPKAKCNGPTLT